MGWPPPLCIIELALKAKGREEGTANPPVGSDIDVIW